jgi:hypothetical protein
MKQKIFFAFFNITLCLSMLGMPGSGKVNGQRGEPEAPSPYALTFNGSSYYVTFGAAPGLSTATFTLETWFKRTGTGTTTSTGTGGVTAVPLLTKGRGEGDGTNVDCNYFLGIRASDNMLVADFEDYASGLNHPIAGVTAIPVSTTWHHAAATYNGTKWQLFLDGKLEAELYVGQSPRYDSIQHAGLGTAMNSTGAREGFFVGVLDEARVWNYARTQTEILSTMNSEMTSPYPAGLLGYWKMNTGSGTSVIDETGHGNTGTLTNSLMWIANGFDISGDTTPPAAPTGLAATAGDKMNTLAWTANGEGDLRGYNVYRNTSTPVPLINPINGNNLVTTTGYVDGVLSNGTTYYYVVTAVDSSANHSAGSTESNAMPTLVATHYALQFNGSNQYVTFGVARKLGVETFTVETWFKRLGTGLTADTGGVVAEPLVTKGRGEADGSNVDMNFFLGIRPADGFLVADFEDGANGANHPVIGTSSVADGQWHHAALTYGVGSTAIELKLYLDGIQQGSTITVNKLEPRSDSIQHAALATAMNSTGTAVGYFNGVLDEVRIWDYARSQTEINTNKGKEIMVDPHLLARWGLNDGSGTIVTDTSGRGIHGTTVNSPTWVTGYLQPDSTPPTAPIGLTATPGGEIVILSWTASSEPDLAGYNVYRSETTPVPTITPINSTLLTSPNYTDHGLTNDTLYYYVVTAVDTADNQSGSSNQVSATPVAHSTGLQFDGTDDYVTFGQASNLGVTVFTLEAWVNRASGGKAMSTGTGGLGYGSLPAAYPVLTKGMGEGDSPANLNMNYWLGIATTGVIAADFEDTTDGTNHPILSTFALPMGEWHHIAVTFNGSCWQLYLDGSLQAIDPLTSQCPNKSPESTSIQHAAIASALQSSGLPHGTNSGYLSGVIDEARVWSVARTQAEIIDTINDELTSGTNLIARWGLNEGHGTTIFSSVGTFLGTLMNGPVWVDGAPFNVPPPSPPDFAPTNLSATLAPGSQIDLAWDDNSSNESSFAVEYALSPACDPDDTWISLGSSGVDSESFRHWNTSVDTQYCYRIRAVNGGGTSDWSNTAIASTPEGYSAFSFGRNHAFVRFPQNVLHLKQFTLETWFRREGTGVYDTTGTGGIPQAIPLISKGAAEAEGTVADENFLLVIDDATDVIAADFEECDNADIPAECPAGGTAGLNHPILGTTPIVNNTWYHAAVTYDGTTWKLYLNGTLERELAVGRLPRWDNNSFAGLGTSMKTDGTALGFFDGSMDEVRIWNYARSESDIRFTMNQQIADSTSGLVARWSLDEASGTAINGSAGTAINGSIYLTSPAATGWNWTQDAPFNATLRPNLPFEPIPADNAVGVVVHGEYTNTVVLSTTVSDPDTLTNLTAKFYGRPLCDTAPNFTIVALPDTQYYSSQTNNGLRAMFDAQTSWIVNNEVERNISFVTHLGDIVDTYSDSAQWDIAGKLTAPKGALTALDDAGIMYGLTVGNHDGGPSNTANFNSYFPSTRIGSGHYGSDNDNNYRLFTAGGMNFIVIQIEYGTDAAVRAWANERLQTYSSYRAIVVTHNLLSGNTTPASFSTEGQALYDALKANLNLFLMLGGHLDTEVSRTDEYPIGSGHYIYSLRSDYQTRNGGNGWLRLMEFHPAANEIQIYTYSPYLNQWETDTNSQFTLAYDMDGEVCAPWQLISTNSGVSSGSVTSAFWQNRVGTSQYEWYVSVSDGVYTVNGPIWSFTTASPTPVRLENFHATSLFQGVQLDWQSVQEIDLLGFNLYRAEAPDGSQSMLNTQLIPAVNPGSLRGNPYQYLDTTALTGTTYYYWLEWVGTGASEMFGPVNAVSLSNRVWLPIGMK